MATRCILVADDDEDDFLILRDALSECCAGTRIERVEDGEQLLDWLRSHPAPQVVLLDLNMPRKDGREALREIKADPQLRRIPVVILATSSNQKDVDRSYDLGSNSYIRKPSGFAQMKEFMRTFQRYWFELARLPEEIYADG